MLQFPFSEARRKLTEIISKVAYGNNRAIITKSGKKMAAIISVEDLDKLEAFEDKMDILLAEDVRKELKEEPPIPWEKAKEELDL